MMKMKIRAEKTRGDDPELLGTRLTAVSAEASKALLAMDEGIVRFEMDVEWADGGRVKVEGRA